MDKHKRIQAYIEMIRNIVRSRALRLDEQDLQNLWADYEQLQADNYRLEQQLKEGHHCQSFDMCGEAHEYYEKKIEQLQNQNKRMRKALEIIKSACRDNVCNFCLITTTGALKGSE